MEESDIAKKVFSAQKQEEKPIEAEHN